MLELVRNHSCDANKRNVVYSKSNAFICTLALFQQIMSGVMRDSVMLFDEVDDVCVRGDVRQ